MTTNIFDQTENEIQTLVCAIGDKNFFSKARLLPDEFQNVRLKKIYEALLKLKVEDYKGEDYKAWVLECGRISKQKVDDLVGRLPFGAVFALEQVRLNNKQDQIKKLASECDNLSAEDIMARVQSLNSLPVQFKFKQQVEVKEYADSYRDYLKARRNKTEGIFSGRVLFDKYAGFERGQLCILGARPSVGKSALALNLAYEWAQYGFKVYYASLEMAVEELVGRLYARITGVSATKFKYGNVDEATIKHAESELKAMPGFIEFGYLPGSTVEDVLISASSSLPDILILDHIDLIQHQAKGDSEAFAIAKTTGALKAFAGQKKCFVFCLSQFNREAKGEVPEMHQLRGSGAKEQDSDVVLILHRSLDPDSPEFSKATLRIAKNRSGQVGNLPLNFKPETTLFYE